MGLKKQIEALASFAHAERDSAAEEIFVAGAVLVRRAARAWMKDADVSELIGTDPAITVGIAVSRDNFEKIRVANGNPRLAEVPPEQDAEEFELHFTGISLDILTSKAPEGNGAIARYLARNGEGIQQVEFLCKDVDRATALLREKFGVTAVYPETRSGADGTRVNFFLVATPENEKVLIELYEKKT
jgi:methylmalonyl-CoA/ethylmalonyl-CoA epimerase